jgi:hypothetical protein
MLESFDEGRTVRARDMPDVTGMAAGGHGPVDGQDPVRDAPVRMASAFAIGQNLYRLDIPPVFRSDRLVAEGPD